MERPSEADFAPSSPFLPTSLGRESTLAHSLRRVLYLGSPAETAAVSGESMVRMECTSTRAYDVVMTSDVFDLDNHALSDALDCERGLVVLDSGVDSTQETALGEYLESRLTGFAPLIMQLSEESKTVDRVLEICAAAQRHRLGRHDLLVAVGGGVCCDLVSVAASLVRRGLPYVTVPTTLLAQVDAGIALKGAVNFGGHKNYLGCFRAPTRVLVDPGFLRSLPQIELRS